MKKELVDSRASTSSNEMVAFHLLLAVARLIAYHLRCCAHTLHLPDTSIPKGAFLQYCVRTKKENIKSPARSSLR